MQDVIQGLSEGLASIKEAIEESGSLPTPQSAGQVLTAIADMGGDLIMGWTTPDEGLPTYSASDKGKALVIDETTGKPDWEDVGGAIAYSTTEHAIGTWTDGSTIYEKTIPVDSISSGNNNVAHGISNFGKLVDAEGVCSTNGGGTWMKLGQYNSSTLFSYFSDCDSTKIILYVGSDIATYYGHNVTVTLRYTKSA